MRPIILRPSRHTVEVIFKPLMTMRRQTAYCTLTDEIVYEMPILLRTPISPDRDPFGTEKFKRAAYFERYVIKTQPLSRGDLTFEVGVKDASSAIVGKICKISITHIGANYPCTKLPGAVKTEYDNVVIHDDALDLTGCITKGNVTFKALTNWGRGPVVPDLQ